MGFVVCLFEKIILIPKWRKMAIGRCVLVMNSWYKPVENLLIRN